MSKLPEKNDNNDNNKKGVEVPKWCTWSEKHTDTLQYKLSAKKEIKKDCERNLNWLNIHKISLNIEKIENFFEKLQSLPSDNFSEGNLESLNINSSLLMVYLKDLNWMRIWKIDKVDISKSIKNIRLDIQKVLEKNDLNLPQNLLKKLQKILDFKLFIPKSRDSFEEKYNNYNDEICKKLWVDPLLSEAIIEKESEFREYAKWRSWTGYMQLTRHPFRDLIIRPSLYQKYFAKLKESTFINSIENQQVKQNIQKVIELWQKWDFGKEWKNLINIMTKDRVNPYYNLLIWNIYFASLFDNARWSDLKRRTRALVNYNWSWNKHNYSKSVISIYNRNLKNSNA